MSFVWERAFGLLRFANPEPSLREIAAHLREASEGCATIKPLALLALAQMIDPDEKKPAAEVKLELRRLEPKAPPALPDFERRKFLEHQVDTLKRPVKVVFAEAIKKFGGSDRECYRDLRLMRRDRAVMADFEQFLALAKARPKGRCQ